MATETDEEILNHIFNPLLPTGELAFDKNISEELKEGPAEDDTESMKEAKQLEFEGIKAAESEDQEKAILLFTRAIQKAPSRASGYNNRAQSYRLLGDVEAAKVDLNNAINLSEGKGRAACQAFCQRGLIHLRENQTEAAKSDFESAAKLGSQFAKAQLVQLNPYAALCNKMLRDVIGKLQRGESDDFHDQHDAQNQEKK